MDQSRFVVRVAYVYPTGINYQYDTMIEIASGRQADGGKMGILKNYRELQFVCKDEEKAKEIAARITELNGMIQKLLVEVTYSNPPKVVTYTTYK